MSGDVVMDSPYMRDTILYLNEKYKDKIDGELRINMPGVMAYV
jgi:hypothetical protein